MSGLGARREGGLGASWRGEGEGMGVGGAREQNGQAPSRRRRPWLPNTSTPLTSPPTMYSSLQRANHTLSLALSVLFGLLAAIALSSFVLLPASVPGATISVEPLSMCVLPPSSSASGPGALAHAAGRPTSSRAGELTVCPALLLSLVPAYSARTSISAPAASRSSRSPGSTSTPVRPPPRPWPLPPIAPVASLLTSALAACAVGRADLTPLFHWNTKQVFLQLTAEYLTPGSVRRPALLPSSPHCARPALIPRRALLPFLLARRPPTRSSSGTGPSARPRRPRSRSSLPATRSRSRRSRTRSGT